MVTQILVVEDENIVALDIQTSLEKFGYRVAAISDSGDAAIQQAYELEPDLILMDINLRGEIDGVEAAEIIREHLNIPVVYLTAFADDITLQRVKKTGPLGYLLKPFLEPALKTTIELALDKFKEERQLRESQDRLSRTIKSIGDGVIVVDAAGRVTFMNPVAESLTGCQFQAALGQDVQRVLWVVDARTRQPCGDPMLQAIREGKTVHTSQCLVRSRLGQEVLIAASIAPIKKEETGVITGGILTLKDVTQWRQQEEQRWRVMLHDPITQLPNRMVLLQALGQVLQRSPEEHEFALVLLALDPGQHPWVRANRNQLFVEIARRLENGVRFGDLVVRLEGDEFAVLLRQLQDRNHLLRVAERIQQILAAPFSLAGQSLRVTHSMGIVPSSLPARQTEEILIWAREALTQARARGGGCYNLYSPETSAETSAGSSAGASAGSSAGAEVLDFLLESDPNLQQALTLTPAGSPISPSFRLYYQPLIALKTGQISGFEALVRWQHSVKGLLEATEFIKLAEASGSIVAIGQWAYREACQQLCRWQGQLPHLPGLTMSLNLSIRELESPGLVNQIQAVLQVTGLQPERLHLEVRLESEEEPSLVILPVLVALAALGVRLYGSEVNSCESLIQLCDRYPIHGCKLHRSLIASLDSEKTLKRLQAIAHQAQTAGLELIAEGVETATQLAQLREVGCDYGQGYYFAPPLPMEGITSLMRSPCRW